MYNCITHAQFRKLLLFSKRAFGAERLYLYTTIGIGGKAGVNRMGTRFWERKNETKILYLAHVNVTEPKEVLNMGFFSHFSFPKTLLPFFLHQLCPTLPPIPISHQLSR